MKTTMNKLDAELDKLFGPRPVPGGAASTQHPREIAEAQITQALDIGLKECTPPLDPATITPGELAQIWKTLSEALRRRQGFYQIGQTGNQRTYLEVGELANIVRGTIEKSRGAQTQGR